MAHVLVAPDGFAGGLPARAVARLLAQGLSAAGARPRLLPLADGGPGTVAACLAAGYRAHAVEVSGPTGRRVETTIAFDGTTAVVELADTCGLARLPGRRPAPMTATTLGVGEALLAALRLDPARVVVGLGGSASTDGGTGLLSALGATFTDANGAPVPLGGGGLARIARADLAAAREALDGVELVGATDVTNPLTGPTGAATSFAPRKGADAVEVGTLDAGLVNLARHARFAPDLPGAGAAGGTGYALLLLGATLVSGAEWVQGVVDLDAEILASDAVVTGGRGFAGGSRVADTVVERAHALGRPVVAVTERPDAWGACPVVVVETGAVDDVRSGLVGAGRTAADVLRAERTPLAG